MSKPIKLTEELRKKAIEEFAKTLASVKMADGKVNYSKKFEYSDEDKAKILFTPLAYTKMVGLIMNFDSEIAWHGVGQRLDGASFLISDILVYPQSVTGTTVEMDTEEYAKWIMENDEDDRFNHIIMQGHSHVCMGTSPSTVDISHQEEILSQLSDDMFYIFLIWNKKLEHTTKIYDLANNTLYENKDISYGIADSGIDLDSFIEESKSKVKKKTYTTVKNNISSGSYYKEDGYYGGGYDYQGYNNGYNGGHGKQKNKQKGKSDFGSGWNGRGLTDMDDDADDIYLRDRFNT